MPNRILKESIHTSDRINSLSDFQFRVWASLLTYVDDYGRGDARPAVIRGACFPLRERVTSKDISAALADLAGAGCVGLYEVGGRPYLYFPNWEKYQTVRNKVSKYPDPMASGSGLKAIEINCNQLNANVPVIQSESNPNPNPNPKGDAPTRHRYGEYGNVLLTDEEMEKLRAEFPDDWTERIDRLSSYIASKGDKYKNHLATIRNWARKDQKEALPF